MEHEHCSWYDDADDEDLDLCLLCGNRSAHPDDIFCSYCLHSWRWDVDTMFREIARFLEAHARFNAWCAEHAR